MKFQIFIYLLLLAQEIPKVYLIWNRFLNYGKQNEVDGEQNLFFCTLLYCVMVTMVFYQCKGASSSERKKDFNGYSQ